MVIFINPNQSCGCRCCKNPFQMSPMGGNPYGLSLWNNYPPMGRCCSPCRHVDDKLDRALLIGAGFGLATGLVVKFAKSIGKALTAAGKAVWSGIKWTGKKVGQAATWLWNNTLGRLFKKKNKSTTEADGK